MFYKNAPPQWSFVALRACQVAEKTLNNSHFLFFYYRICCMPDWHQTTWLVRCAGEESAFPWGDHRARGWRVQDVQLLHLHGQLCGEEPLQGGVPRLTANLRGSCIDNWIACRRRLDHFDCSSCHLITNHQDLSLELDLLAFLPKFQSCRINNWPFLCSSYLCLLITWHERVRHHRNNW